MVKQVTRWVCPYCSTEFESEDEADGCARDCHEDNFEEPDKELLYMCECCEETFATKTAAENCENSHPEIEEVDKRSRESLALLAKEAAHPSQTSLCGAYQFKNKPEGHDNE